MTEIDNRYVKSGYWVNVDRGPSMGGTITTDVNTGTFIVALLAILSSLGVSHLWNLVTFACHQIRAHGRKSDALFWQQQALLRSQLPPSAFLADWIKLWWVWRKKAKRVSARSFFYIPLGLVFTASIIAVGIFSSFIIDNSNIQVLASNPECGYLDLDLIGDNIGEYKREIYKRSESYADECYVNSTHLPVRCSIFLRPNLFLTPERVPCPFDKSVCIDYNTTGVSVDSGLVNANNIIGWNLDLQDQVKFRRKATCGVLKTREYSQIINGSDYPFPTTRNFLPGEQLLVSRYWQNDDPRIWQNVTFAHSLLQSNISDTYSRGANYMFWSPLRNKPREQVISGLAPEKGDLALTQIRPNNVRYLQPVNDPVFAAHQPVYLYTLEDSNNMTQYLSDWPASTIGCIQQYQYCILRNNQSDLCTELSGLPFTIDHEQLPGASDTQLVAIKLIIDANYLSDSTDASRSLEAGKLLDGGYMLPLPDDQWIKEVVGWEKTLWASFQIILSDYANGYGLRDAKVGRYIRKPSRPGERKLCDSQRMRKSGGFVNINVFGLALVTTVSCVVTLLDIILLKFVIFLQSFRQAFSPRIDRWVQDGVFQLQRRAFESQGQGIWIRREKEIPAIDQATELDELGDETSKIVCTCASSVATKHASSSSLSG